MIARRPLGQTGLLAPCLGFGVSGPHGLGLAPTDRLVRMAYEAGASLFDTAPFYGDSERRLGAALKGLDRERCLLVTKAGTARANGRVLKDFSPAGVTASVDRSLRALGTSYLDILLLHGPAAADLTDALAEAMADLTRRGLIRAAGVCTRGAAVSQALSWPACAVLQAPISEPWAVAAQARGVATMGIEALRGAAPAGRRMPRSLADVWYAARALRSGSGGALQTTAHPEDQLRAALNAPGVETVIITTTRPAHLAANLRVAADLTD